MYERILVPVDGSRASTNGLVEAIRIAKSTRAIVRLIHVVNTLIVEPAFLPLVNYGQILDTLRAEGKKVLADADALARRDAVTCETVLIETPGVQAAQAIVKQAHDWPADLIVMGTHGRRGVRRLALGSDAEIVLRYAPVPVLFVRETPAPSLTEKEPL